MADRNSRLPINAPGKFYVDETCIDCDACRQAAPDFFVRSDEDNITYVVRQPQTPEEEAIAQEGLESCPTDSIGCDGEIPSAGADSEIAPVGSDGENATGRPQ